MLFLALPLLLGSCSEAEERADKLAVTRRAIIEAFKAKTGRGLERVTVSDEIREWADRARAKVGFAYAGGFQLRVRAACVPLVFRVGRRSATARFGLGRACG
jgi:hypothetical protein